MGTQKKLVPNSKYGITMSEIFKLRVTPSQKTLLSLASASADSEISNFWREYNVYTAELMLKVKAGELTAEQAGELLGEYLSSKVATEQDEP